jgi:hypothetical protein
MTRKQRSNLQCIVAICWVVGAGVATGIGPRWVVWVAVGSCAREATIAMVEEMTK